MMNELLAFIHNYGKSIFGELWIFVWTLVKIVCILAPLLGATAFLTLWERKLIGWMHIRLGPNRIGPFGLLQPVADGIKAIFKEITVPAKAHKFLFLTAPVISITAALLAWVLIPFAPEFVLADVNVGLLLMVAIVMFGIYGAVIAGWASNSRYAILGAMRAAAQMISFALVIGFILVTVAMVSGSLNLSEIVRNQGVGYFAERGAGFLSWNWLPLFPMFVIYVISSMAETGRHPFDVIEGESEIVNGHMIEYSGISFALFFLAEYCNMILLSAMASIMFLGGWLPPLNFAPFTLIPGWIWLGGKTFIVVSVFIWVRASFPRYRYDQIMRLGWKVFLPITLFYIVFLAVWMKTPWNIW